MSVFSDEEQLIALAPEVGTLVEPDPPDGFLLLACFEVRDADATPNEIGLEHEKLNPVTVDEVATDPNPVEVALATVLTGLS